MPTVTWARLDPMRRAAVIGAAEAEFGAHGFSRGQPERHRSAGGSRQRQPFPVLRGQARPLRVHRRRRQSAGACLHGGPHPRARRRQAILRVPYRPARLVGRLLRRPSAGTLASCRGESGGRHRCAHQRADRHSPPLPGSPAAARSRRTRPRRLARRRRHRRIVVAAAADLSAPGARAVRARNGSVLGLDEPTPEQPALAVRRLVAVLEDAFAKAPRMTSTTA